MDAIVEFMKNGFITGPAGQPMAQNTHLGWIMSGKIDPGYPTKESKCLVSTIDTPMDDISRFWEIEELNPQRNLTIDEQRCEDFYQQTTRRDDDGKYIVKIPFKTETTSPNLGTSRKQCLARFLFLEKRFAMKPELKIDYVKVINEYLNLGHMRDVTDESSEKKLYYIPHHAVIKPDSLTTKTRVVFDASAKTSSGVSLNGSMYTGAKQQDDLFVILIRWRKYRIVYKADIEKMYRQLKLDEEDQRYHTILWRDDHTKQLKEYQLTTATFGTAAAPFMATRTLKQIGIDNQKEYPLANEVISRDFYVDDLISGADDVESALKTKDEVMAALQRGGMSLRKWTSNSQELLETLPEELTKKALQSFSEDETTKALGLQWNPKTDDFSFKVSWDTTEKEMTKRQLFSEASRLFDPLGWLAPVIIKAKLQMQAIWTAESKWDEKIPEQIENEWSQFRKELPTLGTLRIPRWINYELNCDITLHGFCDASVLGYAAVVYTRIQQGAECTINLVASKTRVSPVKTKLTLPRLELCGAVILGTLMNSVQTSLKLENCENFAWCDSMITLGWIKSEPARWKTFVANRIVEIQSNKINNWNYVKSEENPSDCASRGIMPAELMSHPLWFTGPPWLKDEPKTWPNLEIEEPEVERRAVAVNVAMIQTNELLQRTSTWFRMVRVMAICRRFITKKKGHISVNELEDTRVQVLKLCQAESFSEELRKMSTKGRVSKKSKILSLKPFIDEQGLLRVGGRLENANLPYNQRHPIILPANHHMTKVIIKQMHQDTLHGGTQLVTNLLRKKYWIINGQRMANNEISRCVTCRRFKGTAIQPLMGNLPKPRVTLNRVFAYTGVDYAGPVEIKSSKLKSARIQKAYIAVYVCMSTKAIHLELVSDETAEAFLASFNRFVARRSLPITMYSDNGGNFVKGAGQLENNLLKTRTLELSQLVVNQGVDWEFIPPKGPNFGGLWERGVQSVKGHLKRTLKTSKLTFEEYNTVLCQIEACLNSRSICPMSTNTENLDVLTPGHFLVGASLLAPPEPVLEDNTYNNVHRWKYVQLVQQQFWKRWHVEYLTSLQQRHKWTETSENVKIGEIVLIKEDNIHPRKWLMGKLVQVHPGKDGNVRVATMKVMSGNPPKATEFKRPVNKLCPLLTEADQNEQDLQTSFQQMVKDEEKKKMAKDGKDKKQRKQYNLRSRKTTMINMAMMVFALFMVFGSGIAQSLTKKIRINPITTNPGIYFENAGRASMTRAHWDIIVYFDLSKYLYEVKMINDAVINLKSSFGGSEIGGQSEEMVQMLQTRIADIKMMNTLLKVNKHPTGRVRRGAPLNIVGWAANQLFGVMDSEHAEKLEADITEGRANANHLLELIQNHTSVIELTTNLIKTTQIEADGNFDRICKAIKRLVNETDASRRKEQVMEWIMYIGMRIDRIERVQRNIIHMLTDLQQGHVSSFLFTPSQFKEQLDTINDHVPIGNKLPVDPQHDMKSFYEIMRGMMRVTERYILIEITIPLVSIAEFQVFHVIPVPTQYKGQRIAIVPQSEYLLITLQRDLFYTMNQNEFDKCMKPPGGMLICRSVKPLNNAQSKVSQCERDLLARRTDLSQFCKFNVSTDEDVWIQLQARNKWIFDIKDKATLNVVCAHDVDTIILHGTGILEIQSGCEVSHHGTTMVAESRITSKGLLDFSPMVNLSSLMGNSSMDLEIMNITNHKEQFDQIYRTLNAVKQQSKLTNNRHKIAYGTGSGIILFVIIIFIIWNCRNRIRMAYNELTSPKPSNSSTDHDHQATQLNDDGEYGEFSGDIKLKTVTSSPDSTRSPGGCPFRT